MNPIIETKNLTKCFADHKAVNNISLKINQGDIYGLIGRNGAGKTTFMKMISNLSKPSSGTYQIFPSSEKDMKIKQTRVSALIENVGSYPTMTAYDNMLLKGKSLGLSKDSYIYETLNLLGLGKVGKKKIKDFSLGMKQRLGIALALVGNPDIMILDEPINGLDPQGIIDIRNIIAELNRERNITFLISSHILDELAKLATNFAIIDNGYLVANFSKKDLEESTKDRIEVLTDDPKKAILALDQGQIGSYRLVDATMIHIYVDSKYTNDIISCLYEAGIKINYFNVHNTSLEEYYIKLLENKGV
ncbi:ABC transporter ATP-binding protein [Anaerococcus sp. Marseille-P3625]|uniref:ABC transporter ATP-binding protein n=1 Tax=Anaerococcus sp. Marseille-P3625 TaxID=1977277 RepID=UPI000C06AE4D|nr:ABC transporter ATP-binding protein [Anaerococcus sp. Marseille-P3625]